MLRIMCNISGNLDSREGQESYPIIKSMIPWSEKLYDMTPEQVEEYRSVYRDEYNKKQDNPGRDVMNVFYIEYQYYQLRRTYQWVLDQYKLSGDKMAVRREILLQRLRGSTESPIDPEDIEYLISNMKKSVRDIIIDNKWKFLLYDHGQGNLYGRPKDLDEDIPYLVGIDPAAGGGGDNFAVTIINPYNLRIAAEFKSNYISGPAAVKMLVSLVKDYIPKAVLIPERNNIGYYLIQYICEETSIKENLYWNDKNTNVEEIADEDPDDYQLKKLAAQYKKYGHWTGKNRGAMFELLFMHIAQCKDILCTEYLVDDICKLIKKNGKIKAIDGEHDDNVMSYLIAIYTYYNADNLIQFGIDPSMCNPVIGTIEDNVEEKMMSSDPMAGFFSTNTSNTYDDEVINAIARDEEVTRDLVSKFNWIHDGSGKYQHDPLVVSSGSTVDIPPSFFDTLNGV